MNVLLTGSTAAHVSVEKNSRTVTFPGLFYQALVDAKHNVTWIEPSVSMSREYIAEFDSVVVGIAPPTSTSAHRIYGALSVIYHAWELGNLRLLVDAPDPRRVWAGLNAIQRDPESLVKDFFSKKSEYRKAKNPEVFDRIYKSVELLVGKEWPTTYYPTLPWMSYASVASYIPRTNSSNLIGLTLDQKIINKKNNDFFLVESPQQWTSDSVSSPWTKKQERLVSLPVVPLKTSRWEGSKEAMARLSESIGCLITVYRSGDPWWSPAISQSLQIGVPVVTDWLLSSMLGESWRHLPVNIEDMTSDERRSLALDQKETYCSSLLTWKESVDLVTRSLVD